MLQFNIDDRSASACAACCCEQINLRAGEVRLVTLNYAPWTIPIMANGGPGLIPQPEIAIEEIAGSCPAHSLGVLGNVFNAIQAIAVDTEWTGNLIDDVVPVGPQYEFTVVPLYGPSYGTLEASPIDGTAWAYSPNPGFTGWDQIWVQVLDADGSKIIRPINIKVGDPDGFPPKGWGPDAVIGVQIDRSKVKINHQMQTVTFPISLPPSNGYDTIDACRRYRVTVRAYARDCDNTYSILSCLDVSSARC